MTIKDDHKAFFLKKYSIFTLFFLFFLVIFNFISDPINVPIKINSEVTKEDEKNLFKKLSEDFLDNKISSPYKRYRYTIKNNDSIGKVLKKYNISSKEVQFITSELRKRKLTNIYVGRELKIVLKSKKDFNSIVHVHYPVSNTLNIEIQKEEGEFVITENIIKLDKKIVLAKNSIKKNLYSAAIKSGVEPNIIVEFARIYGFEIDFQRDIRKGDTFKILYEKFVDERGVVQDTGKIIYASMFVNNEEINLYNFTHDEEIGYYDLNGKSIVKSLMKTPINGARLSSSFGMRKHPILGFNKMHQGTDFAAPTGTPIMASGSGTVTRARWCGGGGNCVKIKHNSTYQTVYAHMKNFAKGIKEGKKVTQGQIIGYVGSTGMSTGPHLHYEVIVNGKKVNSQKLKLPSGKTLKNEARKNFEIERIKIDLILSEM